MAIGTSEKPEAANFAQMQFLALSNQVPAALQHYRRYATLLQTDVKVLDDGIRA